MLIQNANNMGQQTAGLASDSGLKVAVATPSNVEAKPSVAVNPVVEAQPSSEQLKNAVDIVNKALLQSNHQLEFTVDPTTKTNLVKLVDTKTGDLIRQYPSETALAISQSIDQFQKGLFLKEKS